MSQRMPIKPSEQPEDSVDARLFSFLRRLQSHFSLARARLKVYEYLHEARRDSSNTSVIGSYRAFFQFAEGAFYLDVAVTVEKLFAPDGKRSLFKYLNKCRSSLPELSVDDSIIDSEKLKEQVRRLEELEPMYDQLETLRNKWFAHHDPEAFDDPQAFATEYSLSKEDLQHFVEVGQSILDTHYRARGIDIRPDMPGEDDFRDLIDTLQKFHEVKEEWSRGQIGQREALKKLYPFGTRLRNAPGIDD